MAMIQLLPAGGGRGACAASSVDRPNGRSARKCEVFFLSLFIHENLWINYVPDQEVRMWQIVASLSVGSAKLTTALNGTYRRSGHDCELLIPVAGLAL